LKINNTAYDLPELNKRYDITFGFKILEKTEAYVCYPLVFKPFPEALSFG
jgi:hypothetical protein